MQTKAKLRNLLAARLILVGIIVVALGNTTSLHAEEEFSIMPPKEVTPKIVAGRGCIEGMEHPSERRLTVLEQIDACDDFVTISDNKVNARLFRAWHLHENGITNLHRDQAYRDFSFVIDSGAGLASTFAYRAELNTFHRDDLNEALQDINRAIELKADKPRAFYFELRATILMEQAWRNSDENLVYIALDDVKKIRLLKPQSEIASKLENWAAEFLKSLMLKDGHEIQPG